jgi:ABC transport system ATP-binding/permease protein
LAWTHCGSLAESSPQPGAAVSSDLILREGAATMAVDAGVESHCLSVDSLGLTMHRRLELLSNVSFTAGRGSLTAVIGPSGAGKSTLAKLIGGALAPTTGGVTFEGRDLHGDFAVLRTSIGLVPQDNVVHDKLTVDRALQYAAELRLPSATTKERRRAVSKVLDELELTEHANTRIDRLSGGQRKRASMALELLTEPSLLILDEPTSGLDPSLDRQVMWWLRRLADAGRVVIVITHCLNYLDVCDQVLILAPGGKTAYCGPPCDVASVMGTANWADIFARVGTSPEAVHREFLISRQAQRVQREIAVHRQPVDVVRPHCPRLQHLSTVARRQFRLAIADRGYFAFLSVMPFILGALSLVVPGHVGFGTAEVHGGAPNEPAQILVLLNISAIFMGMALSIRDLVGERTIFQREQAAGLSATAYLLAKILVFCVITAVQTLLLTTIAVLGKGGPTRGAVIFGNAVFELYVTLATTAAVAVITGLALSSAAKSQDQILPMLVICVMLAIVFSGGLIPMTDRPVLNQLSWLTPARWGFAASASTVDLRNIAPLLPPNEVLWTHTAEGWLAATSILALLGIVMAAYTRLRVRLRPHRHVRHRYRQLRRPQPPPGCLHDRIRPSERKPTSRSTTSPLGRGSDD